MVTSLSTEMCKGLDYNLKPLAPTIADMPSQKVVAVSIKGDPNKETPKVMKPLYGTAYTVRKIYKELGNVFKVEKLRGRWPDKNMSLSKDKWTGEYALPVPNDVKELPELKDEKKVSGVDVKLTSWEYGKVGQILHVGSYTEEGSTIRKLHEYVKSQGYNVVPNSHEEIYLTDPTKSSPDKMKTLLLCRLEK